MKTELMKKTYKDFTKKIKCAIIKLYNKGGFYYGELCKEIR